MGRFTITHDINCDSETFWKVFFDKTFNERLYRDTLGFPTFEIVDQREDERQITRRVRGTPKMNLPGPVAKLMGPNFTYTEEGTLDRAKGVWTWKLTTSAMPDKIRQEGTMRLEPTATGVRRVADLVIEAKVFGVGGLIESSAEKQLREGWDHSAVFLNSYLKDLKK